VCVERFPSRGSACLPAEGADSPKHPRWSPDGKRLFYDPRPSNFESVEVTLEPEVHFGKREPIPYHPIRMAPPGYRTPYDINKDGKLVGLIPMGQDEYQMKPSTAIAVVWNWFETLKQKFK